MTSLHLLRTKLCLLKNNQKCKKKNLKVFLYVFQWHHRMFNLLLMKTKNRKMKVKLILTVPAQICCTNQSQFLKTQTKRLILWSKIFILSQIKEWMRMRNSYNKSKMKWSNKTVKVEEIQILETLIQQRQFKTWKTLLISMQMKQRNNA